MCLLVYLVRESYRTMNATRASSSSLPVKNCIMEPERNQSNSKGQDLDDLPAIEELTDNSGHTASEHGQSPLCMHTDDGKSTMEEEARDFSIEKPPTFDDILATPRAPPSKPSIHSLSRSQSTSAVVSPSARSQDSDVVIGPKSLIELVASCPCCYQSLFDEPMNSSTMYRTINYDKITAHHYLPDEHVRITQAQSRRLSLIKDDSVDDEDEEDELDILPGVLDAGVHYTPTRILAEGWLHKKGTGRDWMGSRAWKARWARLALASVEGYGFDVPLLLIYWYPASAIASTVITLDSTVVLSVDKEDKERWNACRFEIRHVTKSEEEGNDQESHITRTFSAPRKGRDAWVYAISQALLSYEKQKDRARKQAARHAAEIRFLKAQSLRESASPTFDDVWTGDRFVKVEVRGGSPSSSPQPGVLSIRGATSPSSPRLPRPSKRVSPQSDTKTGATTKLKDSTGSSSIRPAPTSLAQPSF